MFPQIKNQLSYLPMIVLCLFILPMVVTAFDYNIPVLPIQQSKQYQTTYYVNYMKENISDPFSSQPNKDWFSLQQDVIRIKLGANKQDGITNVYKAQVSQILEQSSFKGAESVNNLCNVVKVLDDEQGFTKYVANHHLNKSQNKGEQHFISTAYISWVQNIKYRQNISGDMGDFLKGSNGPQLRIFQQRMQNIIVYSITNNLNIHKISINQKSGDFYKHTFQPDKLSIMMQLQNQKLIKKNTSTSIYKPSTNNNIQINLCMKAAQKLLHKYKPDNNKYIQIFQIDNYTIIKCISQQIDGNQMTGRVNVGFFIVQFDQQSHSWNMMKQSNVDINVEIAVQDLTNSDSIYEIIQAKSIQSRSQLQKDQIYIKTLNKLYKVSVYNKKLQLTQLILHLPTQRINTIKYITMNPIHIEGDYGNRASYLLIVQKTHGLVMAKYSNINANTVNLQVQMIQNFNNTLVFDHVESLAYSSSSNMQFPLSQNKTTPNNKYGVLQIVVLTGINKNKQYILQLIHQIKNIPNQNINKLTHILHLNKIYHNYNVNTNKGYYFSDRYNEVNPIQQNQPQLDQQQQQQQEQQSTYINRIQKIIFPSTHSNITNNIGIVQTQHKITYFQYGIPRTLSPHISVASEVLKQDNYGNIADIGYIDYTVDKNYNVTIKQSLRQQQIRDKINQYSTTNKNKNISIRLIRNPINENNLQRIILTLDTYIIILQVNPQKIYHYQYVCNLNSMGIVSQKHKILNDVVIDLQQICEVGESSKKVLGYCQERQIINFVVNYKSIQQQKDYFIHLVFMVIFIVIFGANLLIVIAFWKVIKAQAQKLIQMRKKRKDKSMFQINSITKQQTKTMIQQ